MMDHPLREVLSGYLDGQVDAGERPSVEAHLAECATCRQTLATLRQTVALVQGLDPVAAPSGFRAGVRARLLDERAPVGNRPHRILPAAWMGALGRPTWRTALAAAAVVAIGLFSVNLLGQFALEDRRDQFAARDAGETAAPAAEAVRAPGNRSTERIQPVGAGVPQAQAPAAPGVTGLPVGRQVIRSATLEVEVVTFEGGSKALVRIAEAAGGFVSDSTVAQAEPPYGTFILRVPAFRFVDVLEQIDALGKVTGRRVRGEDVTEEFVDLRARIRNLEHHERQLITFMERATRVADLLAIEQELTRVRGEVEQLTGRLRFLGNRVQMSTVQVTLREKGKQGGAIFWDFGASLTRVRAAFLGTVRQLLAGAERLVVLTSALVPLALLIVAGWWLIRRFVRRGAGAL